MKEKEFLQVVKSLDRKKYHITDISFDDGGDGERGIAIVFKTSHFTWVASVDYSVDLVTGELTNSLWTVDYEIQSSSWESLEDYFSRDDVNFTWMDEDYLHMRGESADEVVCNLVMDMLEQFDEPDMVKRYTDLDSIVKKLEEMNPDDVWLVGLISSVF